MNGASLYWKDSRIKYVEGYQLGMFVSGKVDLKIVRQQKIGLLIDSKIEEDLRVRHLQVADACRATLGLDIGPYVITDDPLGIDIKKGISGCSWGELINPDILIKAGSFLKSKGATAIAIITRFPDEIDNEFLEDYRRGKGVDILAGAESIISHLLSKELKIPCAHAPALKTLPINLELDARAAAEEIGNTFLPCLLVGLSNAPDIVQVEKSSFCSSQLEEINTLNISQIGAVILPEEAIGGDITFTCLERGIPLITVPNPGVLNVTFEKLGGFENINEQKTFNILKAQNYVEAAGLISAMREGISIESLYRPISNLG